MDELTSLHETGVFLRREALEMGYDDRSLATGLREHALVRLRQGAYTSAALWQNADDVGRHRLRSHAVLLSHGNRVALSHQSGAADLGLRLWDVDLDRIHVTRLDGGPGRTEGDVVYHEGAWTPDDIVQLGERLVMAPARCALETASRSSTESGMVTIDSAYDLHLADVDDMHRGFESMRHWPDTQRLHTSVRLARPGAQSVGESRARFLCWSQHLPEPELQYEVYDGEGRLIGTTDFAWPEHRLLGEFDGRVKYHRLLQPGESEADAVFREKCREDALREALGWLMIRLIWADLARRRASAARIRAKMGQSAAAGRVIRAS